MARSAVLRAIGGAAGGAASVITPYAMEQVRAEILEKRDNRLNSWRSNENRLDREHRSAENQLNRDQTQANADRSYEQTQANADRSHDASQAHYDRTHEINLDKLNITQEQAEKANNRFIAIISHR